MRKNLPFIFGLGLWVSVLLSVIDGTSTRLSFFQSQYQKLEVAQTIGIDERSLMSVTEVLLDYLRGERQNLDITVNINNQEVAMFNQREIDHMVDVQDLYVAMLNIRLGAVIALFLSLALLFFKQRAHLFEDLWKGFIQAAMVIGTLLTFIAVYATVDFRSFWIFFHQVLFTNDLWLLNPATDRLILMVPEDFFFSLVSLILLRLALSIGVISSVLYGLKQGLNHRKLKWIALVAMSIDHIGYMLYPELIELRIVGRLAFPIFAFLLAYSIRYTRDIKRFKLTLWGAAILTQLAFYVFDISIVNILFLFAVCAELVEAIQHKRYLVILISILGVELLGVDYGMYGLTSVLWFYYFYQDRKKQVLGFIGITLMFTLSQYAPFYGVAYMLQSITEFFEWGYRLWIQVFASVAMLYLWAYDDKKPEPYVTEILNPIEKYAFYLYYPLHLIVLALLARVL